MKIYNQQKTEILENQDLALGYLMVDVITKIIPEVKEVPPVISGYRVIKEYPSGGKDVESIIEKEGVPYQPEREEAEEIQVYIPFTAEQLKNKEISRLKVQLFETDYKALKFAEGLITLGEYEPIKQQRQSLRLQINQLENS